MTTAKTAEERGLELRKLRAEVEKAERELREAANTEKFERAKLRAEVRQALAGADTAEIELDCIRREADLLAAQPQHANIYTFHAGVDRANVAKAMFELGQYARRAPGCELTVVFNSPGGSVFEGLAFFDFLKALQADGHRIVTKALGMAASMGGILLQAGDKRVIGSNSWLLIHEITSVEYGKTSEMRDALKFTEQLEQKCLNILAERSKLSPAQIQRRWKKTDWWLSAEEAVDLGFADEVGH